MSEPKKLSVLVDTSFLITLFDDKRKHHKTAKKYYKHFIAKNITMLLSPIVISEFHQMQSIIDIMGSGNFKVEPFNYHDGIAAADIAFKLGGVERKRDGSNPKYKDDLKLIAQADNNKIDFIITEDDSTLARYIKRLNDAKVLETKCILLKDGFEQSWFNGGQSTLDVGNDEA